MPPTAYAIPSASLLPGSCWMSAPTLLSPASLCCSMMHLLQVMQYIYTAGLKLNQLVEWKSGKKTSRREQDAILQASRLGARAH